MRNLFPLVAVLAAACHAQVVGTLTVDRTAFVVRECRSGQALGFSGIELADESGRRLRLFANPEGTCGVAVFRPGAAVGDRIGDCGTLSMKAQTSRINGINNLEGAATLQCTSKDHEVSGQVQFKNCH